MLARERSYKTGRNYLDALSGVLGYALELELLETNPVWTGSGTFSGAGGGGNLGR